MNVFNFLKNKTMEVGHCLCLHESLRSGGRGRPAWPGGLPWYTKWKPRAEAPLFALNRSRI